MSKRLETCPNNLPTQLSSFIGREHSIAELKSLLSTTRLLTLTGAGGSGKTRLALQVAGKLLAEFEHGVWWVELAALTDPVLVPQQVASSLGISEQPGRPLMNTLSDALQTRKLLLVLDNCEHLVVACARLVETLLHSCADLRILDGMPLAIELAAARVRVLSVEQIATRLDDSYRLFAGGRRCRRPLTGVITCCRRKSKPYFVGCLCSLAVLLWKQ